MLFGEFKKMVDIDDGCMMFDSDSNYLCTYDVNCDFGDYDNLSVDKLYCTLYGFDLYFRKVGC